MLDNFSPAQIKKTIKILKEKKLEKKFSWRHQGELIPKIFPDTVKPV